ncbi:MAG: M50 family metallopeptidase [Candidatus Paceibacterota bacterium]
MTAFFVIFLIYLSLALHEFGHMETMLNKGLKVLEFGIGLPAGPRICYTPKTGKYAGVCFSFYLLTWFLGGFVRCPGNDMENLPYKDKAFIACAGPFANIHFGCLLIISVYIASIAIYHPETASAYGLTDWILYLWLFLSASPYFWVSLITVPVLWFGRKWISIYLGPVIGALLLAWLVRSILQIDVTEYASAAVGPVGFAAELSEMTPDFLSALLIAGQFSIAIGAFNLLPIPPMDGGLLILPAIEKISPRLASFYQKVGLIFIVLITVFVFAKDIINYVGYYGLIPVAVIAFAYFFEKILPRIASSYQKLGLIFVLITVFVFAKDIINYIGYYGFILVILLVALSHFLKK